jgi:hypothetical protein
MVVANAAKPRTYNPARFTAEEGARLELTFIEFLPG